MLHLPPVGLLIGAALQLGARVVRADVYLNNPRGSNNKLSEQSNNVQNAERLFDSQNNDAGGYQIGDRCLPVCQDEGRNYDETKEGAMNGTMTYYQGSELYIEWLVQHGSGLNHPNLHSQLILQYMCESDNPGIRDGTKRGNDNTAGGNQEPPTNESAADPTLGQHEPLQFYLDCKQRDRNQGLYTADQDVRDDRGATATRQNPNGNGNANDRHGLECPEERDYFPYWHPTPWHDIAVLTSEPERCDYYRRESQNVMAKGFCSLPQYNRQRACEQSGGVWHDHPPFGEDPPECTGPLPSRDNHLGGVSNGKPAYFTWTIPETASGRCVFRVRYNISTADFDADAVTNQEGPASEPRNVGDDHFFVDHIFNDKDPGQRRRSPYRGGLPVLSTNPQADFVNLGNYSKSRALQLQVNTNQYGRTFEDRTHTFFVRERPGDVPPEARIVNYNVRGRRGNIVQVYPSVEYDFVPPDLTVEQGTFLHFQWVGSDANPQGNAGNGRQGTDRSNLVQVASRGENVPLAVESHTLFFNAQASPVDEAGRQLVDRFAYLDQDAVVECDPDSEDDNSVTNCMQLNGASAYFDGGLVQMQQVGVHHFVSTRNNDFSNRSQKATITVTRSVLEALRAAAGYASFSIVIAACVAAVLSLAYLAVALYGLFRPTSWAFSKRCRPRVLRWCVPSRVMRRKLGERKSFKEEERKRFALAITSKDHPDDPDSAAEEAMAKPAPKPKAHERVLQKLRLVGLQEMRLSMALYAGLNMVVFCVGFFSNLKGGFQESPAYPFAKGAGYTLDLNLAVIILPTLKSLQTMLRGSGTREWMPIDDPIHFHIAVAGFILVGTVVHVGSHLVHMHAVASTSAQVTADPADAEVAGTPMLMQCFDWGNRLAPLSGAVVMLMMAGMYTTAMPCARRATNRLTRLVGGYNLFWRVHLSWKWIYVLLLLHAPERLWIWLVFPTLFVLVDRMLLANRHRPFVTLKQVRLLSNDVISLTFRTPPGFTYEAGQYILLGWRGEWHPFTLTSAPEERHLSVHIRAPASLDWCSALRKSLTEEVPLAAFGAAVDGRQPKAGLVIDFDVHASSRSDKLYSRPVPLAAAPSPTKRGSKSAAGMLGTLLGRVQGDDASGDAPKTSAPAGGQQDGTDSKDVSVIVTAETPKERSEELPPDAVVLQLSGPFGAPAQKVWQFDTIMVVGAGIGVTPFASILRSVQLRAQQRDAILAAPLPQPHQRRPSTSAEDLAHMLQHAITVPKRIYFYWIVRSQDEFNWFHDLLASAAEGPAQDIINITVFMTGEVELSSVQKLTCVHSQFFGRPNWGRIFKQVRGQHLGEHIGVFLCGSPAIGEQLSKESAKHTDPPSYPDATRFSFYKEYF